MGEFMKKKKMVPSIILSSPAARARHTAELFKDGGGFQAEIAFDGRIYEASPRALREIVSELNDATKKVMLVGHNPGMEGFVRFLTGQLEPMPTASVAVIDLDIKHWEDLDAEVGSLRGVYRPKDLTRS
jgi:phosphohistidine phosphatase